MYQRDFSYKAENSKKGTNIRVNSDPTPEHTLAVLDVLIRSCLKNDDFIGLNSNNSKKETLY